MNEELNTLEQLFSELLSIVKQSGGSEYTPQIRTIESILSCLRDNEFSDISKIEYVVSAHRELYPPRGGLSEFFIWDNDFQTRKQLNEPLDTVRDNIWGILKQYSV
ncbi:hypothetical protein [Listeria rocourtiae]|uniref:hypothetical protein n=1 Tax=Listeria rocourtiae TaxID=647910 RepID=UPI003D2F60B4